MPLFDTSGPSVRPFRRLNSSAEVYESEIEQLFWANLEAFSGEPLFAVARQARIGGGLIPDLLGIDSTGRVVVIEVKRDVDRNQLAQCLEYAGWARKTSLDELASLYQHGSERFFTDWQEFTGTTTPLLLNRAPRLVLVARTFDGRTDSALQYLQDSGVPVKLITVVFYEDALGSRIVDVNNGRDSVLEQPLAAKPPMAAQPSRPRSTPFTRTSVGVTLTDLLEAGLLEANEPIEWRRPQMGELHRARVDPAGAVVADNGGTFTSLSTAADVLAGGSHNGWECWTVPRLGGLKIGALRARFDSTFTS